MPLLIHDLEAYCFVIVIEKSLAIKVPDPKLFTVVAADGCQVYARIVRTVDLTIQLLLEAPSMAQRFHRRTLSGY